MCNLEKAFASASYRNENGREAKSRAGAESECRSGVRIKSATELEIRISAGAGTKRVNEIGVTEQSLSTTDESPVPIKHALYVFICKIVPRLTRIRLTRIALSPTYRVSPGRDILLISDGGRSGLVHRGGADGGWLWGDEGRMGHRNSHSLDLAQIRKLLFHAHACFI
ncbi:hypothetical protein EVAR_46559_1 [Eumeta japonica]|uniref:Uncharacterized protein n=1 Tax=Eumeta variegata TaxID=151549 RepID=A0A4C1XNC2_EUMVA|nr:hypothetical protein EVAR_46559_1 [Eumeta japonica]